MDKNLNATITRRISLTEELARLWIKPDANQAVKFLAGQYVALGLVERKKDEQGAEHEKLIQRTYSICSGEEEKGEIEFILNLFPEGKLSPKMLCLSPGDRLHFGARVTGSFTLEGVPAGSELILVSTGTGIAPFISMLRSKSTWDQGHKLTLIHGVRYSSELAYREELSTLAQESKDFRYLPIVSREDTAWQGERGRVQKYFSSSMIALNPANQHIYLCGSPQMVEDMEALLSMHGFVLHSRRQPGNLHTEKYW